MVHHVAHEHPGSQCEPGADLRSERAALKIAALGEMSGGVIHDLRNILAVIASGLRVAEANAADPDRLAASFTAMRQGVERGLKMTGRLLAFAKHQDRGAGVTNLNTLLGQLEMFLKFGAGPGIALSFQLRPDIPSCCVDEGQFNAAILNLVINARDAMPDGGCIVISTLATDGSGDPGGPEEYVRVRVSDNGRGMSAETQQRIFDPYFTTKGESGTGLGVPQVCRLMSMTGGYVSIDSAPDCGTTFDLFFPVGATPAPQDPTITCQLDRWINEGGALGAGISMAGSEQ